MLSRVAETIFWMSRYTERAENVARFIDVTLNLALEQGLSIQGQWDPLIYTTGDQEIFYERYGAATQENVIKFLTFDLENPNSILSCLRIARENARTSREMISSQMWEELNKFYLFVRDARNDSYALTSPYEFFGRIKQAGYSLEGVTTGTMSHGEPWHFSRLGALVERADKTSRILDVKYFLLLPEAQDVGTPIDIMQWGLLLKSASAMEMYRKHYGRLDPKAVVEFLILNRDFPRSIHFCIRRAEQSLLAITGGREGTFANRAEQRLGRMRAALDFVSIDEIMTQGLHEFVDNFQLELNEVGDAIYETFFAVTPLGERV
ncbi:MAG: alpha-E domain-containing protein [Planctomycetota bacterium]|nr:alpha-E domain-containing protein [Planctomycetota bacterium]